MIVAGMNLLAINPVAVGFAVPDSSAAKEPSQKYKLIVFNFWPSMS